MTFKVGDRVMAVNCEDDDTFYSNGDIGVVTALPSVNQCDFLVDFTLKHTGDYSWHEGCTEWFIGGEELEIYNERSGSLNG